MAIRPKHDLTVEEFLEAYEGAPGRYELVDGDVVKRSAETAQHALIKLNVCVALRRAAEGRDCQVFPDGMTVKINARTAREPDASVQCGSRVPPDSLTLDRPVIVVEVISPASAATDANLKFGEYFSVPSIMHYLIVWPKQGYCYHHKRIEDDKILTTIVRQGSIEFDPPGLTIALNDILGEVGR